MSLPGRRRWCDRPWLCDAQKASTLHTFHQRHPTPSCGGHAPTAERTMNPARMCLESLDRRPGIRKQPGSKGDIDWRRHYVCFTPDIGHQRPGAPGPLRATKPTNTAGLPADTEHASSPPITIDHAAALSRSCRLVGPVEMDTIYSLRDRGGFHARSTKRH